MTTDLEARYSTRFTEHYLETHHSVRFFVLGMTKNPANAEDIISQTYMKVFEKYHTFDQEKPFLPWILTIARNTTKDFFRKYARKEAFQRGAKLKDLSGVFYSNPDQRYETSYGNGVRDVVFIPESGLKKIAMVREELQQTLEYMQENFSEEYVDGLLMHLRGIAEKEIARHSGISVNASKPRHFRTRKKLKKYRERQEVEV